MKKKLIWAGAFVVMMALASCGAEATPAVEDEVQETEVIASVSVEDEVVNSISLPIASNIVDPDEYDFHLKEFYEEYNMYAGVSVTGETINDKEQAELLLSQFNSITPESAMMPERILNHEKSIAAGNLVVEFNDEILEILSFAKENELKVRGHALICHSQTPDWIFYADFKNSDKLASRDEMLKRMESFIKQVFETLDDEGYSEMFYAYDTVNEAILEDGAMRQSLWYQTIGEDYVRKAFTYARKYAPENISLYYNDYNELFKIEYLAEFADTLVDKSGNYLFDGFGLQSHMYTKDKMTDYFAALDSLTEKGIKIELTEVDVSLGYYENPFEPARRFFKTQGTYYYTIIDGIIERICNGNIKIDSVTYWGISDAYTWRAEYNPCLFDANLEPKFAFYGAMGARKLAGYDFDN